MADADVHRQPIRAQDYQPPAFAIGTVSLTFELGATATLVRAELAFQRRRPGKLVLDGDGLVLLALTLDGAALDPSHYRATPDQLEIADVPDAFTLGIVTTLDPAANTKLMGLYQSGGIFCTQCEAEGFRGITYFLDRPDVLSVYSVRLESDVARCPVLLANGNLGAHGALPGGRHFAEWHDPHPKPCYLFALVAGDLSAFSDQFTTRSGRTVALNIWVAATDVPRCAHAMASLKAAMLWDEQHYGREYDLDVFNIVAVNDFNFGAMENKGLNIFNAKYILADPQTATDLDYDGIEAVVAHEYFHNWTGNRITCRDWFQLSLKEGLTVYRDQEFSSDMGSRALKRIEMVRALRAGQFPEDAGPLAHAVRPDSYIEISNFYTATVYNKGAEVVRMLALLLGPDTYRAATDLYFARHDGQAVTCEDFVACMEDASGRDLTQFRLWYAQAGTPRLKIAEHHDAQTRTFTLDITQIVPPTPGQADKLPMHIPLALALYDGSSGAPLGSPQLVELQQAHQQLTFEHVAARPVASLLRGFSAPVILERTSPADDLALLAACDTDPFARYEALQTLALDLLLAAVRTPSAPTPTPLPAHLQAAFGATLASGLDPALVAEALVLPGEAYIGDQIATVAVERIHTVRQDFRRALCSAFEARWWEIYHATAAPAYARSQAACAQRKLHNLALQYLMVTDSDSATAVCFLHYMDATNMTDRLGALAALTQSNSVERLDALADFEKRYAADPLVLDKWFSLQALSTRADTLDVVHALTRHPAYADANPNRVRALVGSFGVNQVQFHRADGAGYAFVSDQVLAADRLNPQTAARLVAPLCRWKRFDAPRGAAMRQQLERILAANGLSRDVFEIAKKSLD